MITSYFYDPSHSFGTAVKLFIYLLSISEYDIQKKEYDILSYSV